MWPVRIVAIPLDDLCEGFVEIVNRLGWHIAVFASQVRLEARKLISDRVAGHRIDVSEAEVECLGDSAELVRCRCDDKALLNSGNRAVSRADDFRQLSG